MHLKTVPLNCSWIHRLLSCSFHFWNIVYATSGSPGEWKQQWAKIIRQHLTITVSLFSNTQKYWRMWMTQYLILKTKQMGSIWEKSASALNVFSIQFATCFQCEKHIIGISKYNQTKCKNKLSREAVLRLVDCTPTSTPISTYHVPCSILSTLHVLFNFILPTVQLFRWTHWDTKRLKNMPQGTQLVSGGARLQAQICAPNTLTTS